MASSILFQNALPPASSLRLRQTSFPAAVKPDASRSTQISRFTSYVRIRESDLDEYASAEPDFSTAQLLAKMGITLKVQAILHDGSVALDDDPSEAEEMRQQWQPIRPAAGEKAPKPSLRAGSWLGNAVWQYVEPLGNVAGNAARQESQNFRGRVSANVKLW